MTDSTTNLFALLADQLKEHMRQTVDEAAVRQIVKDALEGFEPTVRLLAVSIDGSTNRVTGSAHAALVDLLGRINEGARNLAVVGPAGSGKTTLARQLAEALGVQFGFISLSGGVTESRLTGRTLPGKDGQWQLQRTSFVDLYENGGVFLADELDAADPNVLITINAAISNGQLELPDGRIISRHPKFVLVAAMNTWGRGADAQYVGRNQLDAATMDRFVGATVQVDYDRSLETAIAKSILGARGDSVAQSVWAIRDAVLAGRLRRIVSTRFLETTCRSMAAGCSFETCVDRLTVGWTTEEKAKLP